jgi:DNA-binding CsgD family transcriptional regulator
LIGRDSQFDLLSAFLSAAVDRGDVLLLVGDPGVGKTALLASTADAAASAGMRVLRAEGVQFEAERGFSALNQALLPLLNEIDRLVPSHREALSVALGVRQGPPPDRLVLCNAALSLLRRAATDQPLLLLVDDLQWIDPPSSDVLGFVARRLDGSRVGFLAVARSGVSGWFDHGGLRVYELDPLEEDAARELLRVGSPALAPVVRRRVLDEAQGNPLALLELPSALTGRQRIATQALPQVLPLTERLQALFATRVEGLPQETRRLLLLAVLEGTGELGVLATAAEDPQLRALAAAEQAGLVRIETGSRRLAFRHPILRSAVVELSADEARRVAHATLANVLADHPERRAWHLAEASVGPDETVARLLEETSRGALRRGDARGAVTVLLRAAELTPRGADRARRLAEVAYIAADVTGDLARVSQLLDEAEDADPGVGSTLEPALAAAYLLLNSDGDVDTAHRLLVAAIDAYDRPYDPSDMAIVAALTVLLAVCNFAGRADLWAALDAALARFTPAPPSDLLLLSQTYVDPARTTSQALASLDAAIAALSTEVEQSRIMEICGAGVYLDRLTACRAPMWRVVNDGRESGAVAPAITALILLAADDYLTGQWPEADSLLREALGLCEAHGYRLLSWPGQNLQARLAAVRGNYELAWELTDEVSRWAEPRGVRMIRWNSCHTRALAALGQGEFDYAYQQAALISPPGTFPACVPHALWVAMDLVEAAVHSGRGAEAAAHVRAIQDQGIAALSPRLALLAAGSTAMAAPDGLAGDLFAYAVALPGADRWPFDLARVQLAYGAYLRRVDARVDARGPLTAARDTFRWLGAQPWATRASNEVRATGQSQLRPEDVLSGQLTNQELQIAHLAAAGMSNKQIGARLFLSHRTVGAHLYRLFPKLGISSRAALGDALERMKLPGRYPPS